MLLHLGMILGIFYKVRLPILGNFAPHGSRGRKLAECEIGGLRLQK
jgi:hypothetical protein